VIEVQLSWPENDGFFRSGNILGGHAGDGDPHFNPNASLFYSFHKTEPTGMTGGKDNRIEKILKTKKIVLYHNAVRQLPP